VWRHQVIVMSVRLQLGTFSSQPWPGLTAMASRVSQSLCVRTRSVAMCKRSRGVQPGWQVL
jgi:hypothetical protein